MTVSQDIAAHEPAPLVAGIDEAGRGPLAGPVIAAAVILPDGFAPVGLTDSKKLSARDRDRLYLEIMGHCWVGVGGATVEEIEQINILQATMLAMERAVDGLPILPSHALVDGNRTPSLPCRVEAIVQGDLTVPAISAASVIAKVTPRPNHGVACAQMARIWPGNESGIPHSGASKRPVTPWHHPSP